jgi:hypothetical protein
LRTGAKLVGVLDERGLLVGSAFESRLHKVPA